MMTSGVIAAAETGFEAIDNRGLLPVGVEVARRVLTRKPSG